MISDVASNLEFSLLKSQIAIQYIVVLDCFRKELVLTVIFPNKMKIVVSVTRSNQNYRHFSHCEFYSVFTISDTSNIADILTINWFRRA